MSMDGESRPQCRKDGELLFGRKGEPQCVSRIPLPHEGVLLYAAYCRYGWRYFYVQIQH